MLSRKIILSVLLVMFTAPLAFSQTEALKVVVNNLAYYRQKSELKYLSNAKKSVDSLIKTRSDSNNLAKNVYKAIVYSSIAYLDSTNKLNQPANFFDQTVQLVNKLTARGTIYKYQTEIDFAKRCLANVYIRHGFEQIKQRNYNNAVQSFQKAQGYAPNFGQLNAYIAYANTRSGNYQDAVKYYNGLLTADSVKTEFVAAATNIYKLMGDTAKALQTIQKGLKYLPNDKGLLLEEANIYNNQRDYKGLEPLLSKLLDQNPNNPEVVFLAANCYDHLEDYDRAESLYLRAVDLNNVKYAAVFNLGVLYLKETTLKQYQNNVDKNMGRAAQWLQRASEMAPRNATTLQLLQLIYAKTGNTVQLNKISNKLQQLNY